MRVSLGKRQNLIGLMFNSLLLLNGWFQSTFTIEVKSFSLTAVPRRRRRIPRESDGVSRLAKPNSQEDNVNFLKWVNDQLDEVVEESAIDCLVKGRIPSYISGSLIRNGGGQWGTSTDSATAEEQRYGHIFDGFAKVSRYCIHGESNTVTFTTQFLKSKWRQAATGNNHKKEAVLLPAITVGPRMNKSFTQILPRNTIQTFINAISFDNTPVNVWKYNNDKKRTLMAITDSPVRTRLDAQTLETIQSGIQPPLCHNANGYEFLSTAHPEYCKSGSGCTYNVILELNPFTGNRLSLVKEQIINKHDKEQLQREIEGTYIVPDGDIPYLHSFGLTETKAMIVLQPLRLKLSDINEFIQQGFMVNLKDCGTTRVIVFDLVTNGEILADVELNEPVYFYHTISCAKNTSTNSISLKVCGYKTPAIITGQDRFFRFDRINDRDNISRGGMLCDIQIDLKTKEGTVLWTDVIATNKNNKGTVKTIQGFELPTTRFSRWYENEDNGQYHQPPWKNGQHPKYAYAYGAFANGSQSYDAWNLLKIDLHTGEATSFRERDSCYYSEPIFVSNPNCNGTEEDNGVLLCQRYDGKVDESSLIFIDAQSMELIAEANTGMRNPMDFHGMFLPNE